MIYYLRDDDLKNPRTEHTASELLQSYENGLLHRDTLMAAKGDTRWCRLDSMLSLLRQDVAGPFHEWKSEQAVRMQ